jgi:hypothetical protein
MQSQKTKFEQGWKMPCLLKIINEIYLVEEISCLDCHLSCPLGGSSFGRISIPTELVA